MLWRNGQCSYIVSKSANEPYEAKIDFCIMSFWENSRWKNNVLFCCWTKEIYSVPLCNWSWPCLLHKSKNDQFIFLKDIWAFRAVPSWRSVQTNKRRTLSRISLFRLFLFDNLNFFFTNSTYADCTRTFWIPYATQTHGTQKCKLGKLIMKWNRMLSHLRIVRSSSFGHKEFLFDNLMRMTY